MPFPAPCYTTMSPQQESFYLCPASDLKSFGILPANQPEPYLRFRMLNILQKTFAIEIHLGFDPDRILKIHLNPATLQTIGFMKLCAETIVISFHFSNLTSDSVTFSKKRGSTASSEMQTPILIAKQFPQTPCTIRNPMLKCR